MPRDLTDETQRFLARYFFNFKLRLKRNFDESIIATRAFPFALRVQVSENDFVWITFDPNPLITERGDKLYRPQLRSGGRGWSDSSVVKFQFPASTPTGLQLWVEHHDPLSINLPEGWDTYNQVNQNSSDQEGSDTSTVLATLPNQTKSANSTEAEQIQQRVESSLNAFTSSYDPDRAWEDLHPKAKSLWKKTSPTFKLAAEHGGPLPLPLYFENNYDLILWPASRSSVESQYSSEEFESVWNYDMDTLMFRCWWCHPVSTNGRFWWDIVSKHEPDTDVNVRPTVHRNKTDELDYQENVEPALKALPTSAPKTRRIGWEKRRRENYVYGGPWLETTNTIRDSFPLAVLIHELKILIVPHQLWRLPELSYPTDGMFSSLRAEYLRYIETLHPYQRERRNPDAEITTLFDYVSTLNDIRSSTFFAKHQITSPDFDRPLKVTRFRDPEECYSWKPSSRLLATIGEFPNWPKQAAERIYHEQFPINPPAVVLPENATPREINLARRLCSSKYAPYDAPVPLNFNPPRLPGEVDGADSL